ncbi:MAG: cellobiose phosphorylase [Eubacteriales bacterium]|nr:cellobiose phosphorylase [Eubacteriales bacterium]
MKQHARTLEFDLENPEKISYLYMPLVNERVMSSITPDGHGDNKISQNCFFLEPQSAENLHSSMAVRNFWCKVNGREAWSVFGYSALQKHRLQEGRTEKCHLTAGAFWQRVEREKEDSNLGAEVLSFCPAGDTLSELMVVTLKNKGNMLLRIQPVAAVPIYGRGADHLRDHRHVTSLLNRIKVTEDGVLLTPSMAFDERGHHKNEVSYGVFARDEYGERPIGAVPVLEDFIGEGGSLMTPEAVIGNQKELRGSGYQTEGYEAMGALWFREMTLLPGESRTYVTVLSYQQEGMEYLEISRAQRAFEEMKEYWKKQKIISSFSSNQAFDKWMEWVSLQPCLRRIYGCSFLPYHDYGRGGRGWRDLWQDCLALLLTEPQTVRQNLIDFFAGVRIDGTNATIIGKEPGSFLADRNAIVRVWMDHAYWPFHTVSLYLNQTGDYEFLMEKKPYFRDKILCRGCCIDEEYPENSSNRLLTKQGSIYEGTVLEHLMLQQAAQFYDVGEHNHMRLHGADWNDALDMADKRGESVAFTAAYSGSMKELSGLCRTLQSRGILQAEVFCELEALLHLDTEIFENAEKKYRRLLAFCQECARGVSGKKIKLDTGYLADLFFSMGEWMSSHIRSTELVGDSRGECWFNGYYDNDGNQVEGFREGRVRMMLTGQVFAILSKTATDEQVEKINHAAEKYLYQEEIGGYRLNTDFKENKMNLGRMLGFAYGHKENGAVFCHMSVMYAYALYSRNYVREGYKAIKALADKSLDMQCSRIYPGIPEYFSPRGRGMYPYLTGAGSWMVFTVLTQMYGVRGNGGNLILEPKLLLEQFDKYGLAGIQCRFAGRMLDIVYINKNKKDFGDYEIDEIYVNGNKYERMDIQAQIDREYLLSLPEAKVNKLQIVLE